MSGFYWMIRRYPEGIEAGNRAIAMAPEEAWNYIYKIVNLWAWKGATTESRAVVEAMPQDHGWTPWMWFWQEVGEGNYQEALSRLSTIQSDWITLKTWARPVAMFEAFLYDYLEDPLKAQESYKKARTMLEEAVLKQENDPRLHSSLGIAYAALGSKNKAIEQGKIATDLLPYSDNPLYGISYIQDLAVIYLLAGEYEKALDQIEFLFSVHSWVSVPWLDMNPYWKRLQDIPRYQDLRETHNIQ
jgi:tetratricopeptide (TPR) repeat protein